MIALLIAAAALPRVDAGTDSSIAGVLAAATFPNAVATMRVSQSFQGGLPRITEQRLWANGKKLRVRQSGREVDMYFDLTKKSLVVVDKAQPQAVRFKLGETTGQ